MTHEHRAVGTFAETLSAYEVLVSCGITTIIASEYVFNESDLLNPDTWQDQSNQLYMCSSLLAALCTQHERFLKALIVTLPQDIGAVVVANPLYVPPNEKDHPF